MQNFSFETWYIIEQSCLVFPGSVKKNAFVRGPKLGGRQTTESTVANDSCLEPLALR